MIEKIPELVERYNKIIGENHMSLTSMQYIEAKLGVKFSSIFKNLNNKSSYAAFSWGLFNPYSENHQSVIGATKILREYLNLPHKAVILNEGSRTMTIMETSEDASNEKIYVIILEDVKCYIANEPFQYDYQYFPSFIDFFEFLLIEEEKIMAEV